MIPLLMIASLTLAAPGVHAQDTAASGCARDIDEAAVKDILKSSGSTETKAQRVVDLSKGSVVAKWSSITRPNDIELAISDVARQLISKLPSPLPKEIEDSSATDVSKQMTDALNAACRTQGGDSSAVRAAAMGATNIPATPPESQRLAPVVPATRSSGDAYGVGDRLRFATQTDGFSLVEDSRAGTAAVAPCGAKFRVTYVDKSGEIVSGHFYLVPKENAEPRVGGRKCQPIPRIGNVVAADRDYQVSAERLARAPAYASGYQFGVLVAPYKFHFSDDSTTPSATVGGYFGFQYGSPSVSITPVISVGLGAVTETTTPEPAAEGEPEATQGTLATLSAAAGVLFKIRKAGGFTVGLLVGSDWTGQKERYRYDGKLWAAVSIGMSITD